MVSNKTRLLLVEDHTLVREGIRKLIQKEADMVVVGEAANGKEAIALVNELKPGTVLMDVAMPDMDGIEATRVIKKTHPEIHVLVLTAYDNQEFVTELMKAGVSGYLLKHVRSSDLLNAIRAVQHGESVLDNTVTRRMIQQLQPSREARAVRKDISLSRREVEVVRLGATGLTNKEIASELSLGERTIQTHWRNIFNKLGVNSRVEAIMYCIKQGWVVMAPQNDNGRG